MWCPSIKAIRRSTAIWIPSIHFTCIKIRSLLTDSLSLLLNPNWWSKTLMMEGWDIQHYYFKHGKAPIVPKFIQVIFSWLEFTDLFRLWRSLLKQTISFIRMHNVYLFLLILIHFKNICLKLDSGTRVLFFSGSHCNEFLQENEVMSSKYCVVQMKKEQKRID